MEKSTKHTPSTNVQSIIQIDPQLLKNGTCMVPLNLKIFLNPDSSIGVKVEEPVPEKKVVPEKENSKFKLKNESEKTLTWPQNLTPQEKDSIDSFQNYPGSSNNASLKSIESHKNFENKKVINKTPHISRTRGNNMKVPVRAEDHDLEKPKTCMQFCGLASKAGGCMDPDMEKVLVKTLEGRKIGRANKNLDREAKRPEREVKPPEREMKSPEREVKIPVKEIRHPEPEKKHVVERVPKRQLDVTSQDTFEKKTTKCTQTSTATLDPIYIVDIDEIKELSSPKVQKKADEISTFSISIQVNENDNNKALPKKTEKNKNGQLITQMENLKNHIREDKCTSVKCQQKLDELLKQING